jgi:hypothetical protein
MDGKAVTLEDCIFSKCGENPSKSTILVECGSLILRRCEIVESKGDAIAIQGAGGAHVNLQACVISASHASGVCYFQGYGTIEHCKIHDCAMIGLSVRQVFSSGVKIVENTILRNQVDVQLAGERTLEQVVLRDNYSLPVTVFSFSDSGIGITSMHDVRNIMKKLSEVTPTFVNPVDGRKIPARLVRSQCSLSPLPTRACVGSSSANFRFLHFNKRRLLRHHHDKAEQTEQLEKHSGGLGWCDNGTPWSVQGHSHQREITNLRCVTLHDLRTTIDRAALGTFVRVHVVTNLIRWKSLMGILGDEEGNAAKVAFYNVPEGVHVGRRFPIGMEIGIVEPYLKTLKDGTVGIRVDNWQDVVFLSPVCDACGCIHSPENPLKKCTGCGAARYCSRDCQKADWKQHRKRCRGSNPRTEPNFKEGCTGR